MNIGCGDDLALVWGKSKMDSGSEPGMTQL